MSLFNSSKATENVSAEDVLVIYHGDCPDGLGAAYAAWRKFGGKARYAPAYYGRPLPNVSGRHVFILDFSYSPEVLTAMAATAKSITLLDHHATARDRLSGFELPCPGMIYIDTSRSGAVLAWTHFHPDKPVPRLLRYIQARDLWKWDEPNARDFLAWLDVQEIDFARWDEIARFSPAQYDQACLEGRWMNEKFEALCGEILKTAAPVRLVGVEGLMVNASKAFASDVGSLLAHRSGTFGLVWRVEDNEVRCSLRSVAPFSVRELAEQFGGGGHPQASGFGLGLEQLTELVHGELQRGPTPLSKETAR